MTFDDESYRAALAKEFRFNLGRGGDAALVVAEMRAARADAIKDPEIYGAFTLILAETALQDGVLYEALRSEALTVLRARAVTDPSGSRPGRAELDTLATRLEAAEAQQPPPKVERSGFLAETLGKIGRRKR